MTGHLEVARAACRQYGADLKATRELAGLTLRELADAIGQGANAPTLSMMEHGRRVATLTEAANIHDWAETVPGSPLVGPDPEHGVDQVGARMSDPLSSHDTVASIAEDMSLADRILLCAMDFTTFDDTDLVAEFQRRWPRPIEQPWQRNVIARARGLIGTVLAINELTGEKERVPLPGCVLQHVGSIERTRNGRTRPTEHYTYTGDTHG